MEHGTQKDNFRFIRIFPKLPALVLKRKIAADLGNLMVSEKDRNDSNMPAGYTYFGQFVDHDITRDDTSGLEDTREVDLLPISPDELKQSRSPSLDLDSVYGKPTAGGDNSPLVDSVRFSFAKTAQSEGGGHSNKKLPYDIHRGENIVKIPDNRNDENLAVSQTHALWMRFHNNVANTLKDQTDPDLFIKTKNCVIKHYQYIVIHDFVRRFTDPEVFEAVFTDKQVKIFHSIPGENIGMPLEFSGAAYRFGHSLVREEYDWNLNFNTGNGSAANFKPASKEGPNLSLFTFTTAGGFLRDTRPLPSNWIINWENFFEIKDSDPQKAKAIDPFLSSGMRNIPTATTPLNLAAANLRRSSILGLPSGQDTAKAMKVPSLTKKEVIQNLPSKMGKFIQDQGLDIRTPLWFYILQEANVQNGGKTLGKVGSYIICETFRALIMGSKPSVIVENWTPSDVLEPGKEINSIPKLIKWINGKEPIINPLEDDRL